jgi:predicted RNA-binding protein YlqC (UPF0109 family)
MKQMIEAIFKTIATKPEQVIVNEIKAENMSIFDVIVDKSDLGKMIGKSGKTAYAIRTIIYACSYKFGNRRYQLDIKSEGDNYNES